jgi:hypothetical protein
VAKKASNQAVIGERGVALIARVVLSMGHLWHATTGTDSGIDGEIELRDPATTTVRNVRIGVQSKATTRKWAGETATEFSYKPKPADIAYWLSSNQPVLLICSRPDSDEIYWRSVQEWALDPVVRASGVIRFDKGRDRFESATRDQLFDLRASSKDRVEPPGPAPVPERVLTNLMPIAWRSRGLYSAAVPTSDARALFAPAREVGVHDWSAVVRDGRVWSLASFDDRFLVTINASDTREQAIDEFLLSEDRRDLNVIREVVRRSILVTRRSWLLWHQQKHVAYFRRKPEDHVEVRYAWSSGKGRAVVSPRWAKNHEHFTGYRHDAAEFAVRRFDGEWFAQINPTYLFTWDGRQLSRHHDRALTGIKKQDRHATVSQTLRLWEHLLTEQLTLDSPQLDTGFTLGRLTEVQTPVSINDASWKRISPAEAGIGDDPQASIFDLEGLES